jgi:hypothetical protein
VEGKEYLGGFTCFRLHSFASLFVSLRFEYDTTSNGDAVACTSCMVL